MWQTRFLWSTGDYPIFYHPPQHLLNSWVILFRLLIWGFYRDRVAWPASRSMIWTMCFFFGKFILFRDVIVSEEIVVDNSGRIIIIIGLFTLINTNDLRFRRLPTRWICIISSCIIIVFFCYSSLFAMSPILLLHRILLFLSFLRLLITPSWLPEWRHALCTFTLPLISRYLSHLLICFR